MRVYVEDYEGGSCLSTRYNGLSVKTVSCPLFLCYNKHCGEVLDITYKRIGAPEVGKFFVTDSGTLIVTEVPTFYA